MIPNSSRWSARSSTATTISCSARLTPPAFRGHLRSGTPTLAEVLIGPDADRSIEIYARRSRDQGLREWTIGDVEHPARHRLYRAVASEHSVLEPGGVDVRIPISQESFG